MARKVDIVYSRVTSKFVAPSHQMIGTSDDERDIEYSPSCNLNPTQSARDTRGTPRKVASNVVNASQCDKERTLTSTSSGSALGSDAASSFKAVSRSMSASSTGSKEDIASGFGSLGATHQEVPSHQAMFDEAHSSESAAAPLDDVPAPIADEPNRW